MNSEQELREAGIHFPKALGMPICEHCGTAIRANKVSFSEHLRKKPHKFSPANCGRLWKCMQAMLGSAGPSLGIRENYLEITSPRTTAAPLPQLPGLPVLDVYKCPHCNHFATSLKTLALHIKGIGHQNGEKVTAASLSQLSPLKGQAIWRKKGMQLFFPVMSNSPEVVAETALVRGILRGLRKISSSDTKAQERSVVADVREM